MAGVGGKSTRLIYIYFTTKKVHRLLLSSSSWYMKRHFIVFVVYRLKTDRITSLILLFTNSFFILPFIELWCRDKKCLNWAGFARYCTSAASRRHLQRCER